MSPTPEMPSPSTAHMGSSGAIRPNSLPWDLLRGAFQGESGTFRSRTLKLPVLFSALKLTSWPSLKRWRGRESYLRFQKRAELYRYCIGG